MFNSPNEAIKYGDNRLQIVRRKNTQSSVPYSRGVKTLYICQWLYGQRTNGEHGARCSFQLRFWSRTRTDRKLANFIALQLSMASTSIAVSRESSETDSPAYSRYGHDALMVFDCRFFFYILLVQCTVCDCTSVSIISNIYNICRLPCAHTNTGDRCVGHAIWWVCVFEDLRTRHNARFNHKHYITLYYRIFLVEWWIFRCGIVTTNNAIFAEENLLVFPLSFSLSLSLLIFSLRPPIKRCSRKQSADRRGKNCYV